LAKRFDVHPRQIAQRKEQLIAGAPNAFGGEVTAAAPPPIDFRMLHAKIGELTLRKVF
jgi:hypothetical protein